MNEKKISIPDEVIVRLQTNPDVAAGRLNPALRTISERCLSVMNVDRVNIWKMSPQEDVLQSVDSFDQSLKIHSSGEIIPVTRYPSFLAALHSERFLSVKDVHSDHRTGELVEDLWKPLNVVSTLIVPIRMRGRLEGIIRFEQSRVRHSWTSDEEIFASQIAEIISGVFLLHETNQKELQLRAYEETVADMTRLTNCHTLLTEALHRVIDLTGARSAMLFKNHPLRREIECTLSINTPMSFVGITMAYGEGAAGSVAEMGRSLRIPDYRIWAGRSSQLEEQQPFTSVLAVPVRFQGRIIGVVEAAHHDINSHFTESHRRVLEVYAHHIAVILMQSEQAQTISGAHALNNTLNQLISASNLAGRTEAYLESMLGIVLKKYGLYRGILRVHDTPVTQEMSEEEEREIHTRLASDQAGFNSEIVVEDWREYNGSFAALASMFGTMDIKAGMLVPLWSDNSYKGYVAVFNAAPREWREEEINLLQVAARLTVLTVDKLNGNKEREVINRNLARLNAITSDLNRLLTFDEAIIRVGQGAVDLMNADHAAIFLKNPDGSLSVPWHFAIADTHIQKGVPVENRELIQLLMGNIRPTAYQNLDAATLPALFKKYMSSAAIATVVCLPLIYSNQTVGTIVTFHNFSRQVSDLECDLLQAFTNQAAVTLQNAWMYGQLDKGYTDLALSLAKTVDSRESDISDQTQRVARWAEETGRRVGMNDQEISDLHWAALLHDIGKSSIPHEILGKAGPLNEEELKILHLHPTAGAEMIEPLSRFQNVSGIIRTYREHFDGGGYPNGLKGEEIPLAARVLAVADAYGSMTHDRPYHRARDEREALQEIESQSGCQFDPLVVQAFLEVVGESVAALPVKAHARRVAKVKK